MCKAVVSEEKREEFKRAEFNAHAHHSFHAHANRFENFLGELKQLAEDLEHNPGAFSKDARKTARQLFDDTIGHSVRHFGKHSKHDHHQTKGAGTKAATGSTASGSSKSGSSTSSTSTSRSSTSGNGTSGSGRVTTGQGSGRNTAGGNNGSNGGNRVNGGGNGSGLAAGLTKLQSGYDATQVANQGVGVGASNSSNASSFNELLGQYNALQQQTMVENMIMQKSQAFWNPVESISKKDGTS